ncbi:hypothetical protein SMKI_06G1900 [Saccharomyces mikatae IFO 1815]|uniref:Integrase catalytic domain-containing protein n=1 Tax=Saccharomyces mikatae IFO 1815 TaxID=226126 RepID=A0AA35IZR3_SACMI|nr:uncharacterized protein SMKI_06G1900 [Saccharomyces mikatae IFO 1815]CAI4038841.1 hypothetical protein SMKI_06G1900 [Saccharomyces mikatae IFO 1815]
MLAHANAQTIRYSLKKNTITYFNESDVDWSSATNYQCPDCLIGKSTKHRHIKGSRLKYQNSYEPFQYLHTDIFGPVHNLPKSAPSYFISFTDEKTKFRWVYPLHDRREDSILDVFTTILAFIKNQFQSNVLVIQMDRGSEYTNKTLHKFLEKNGITPCYTTTADSRAHGIAERLNRTLLDDCRTQLQCSGLPNHLWFSAVEFSTIVRNSLASPKSKKSARQHAGLAGLDISTLLPFGQPVIVNNHNPDSKIHPRGITGYALHPSRNSYGYIIYLPSLKKTVDTTNYVILQGKESRLDQFNYDALTFDDDLNRLTASYQSFIASNEIQQSNDLNIESDHDYQSDIELNPDHQRNVLPKVPIPTDSPPPLTHTEESTPISKTKTRAPREVDPNISESNILPSKKRSSIPKIAANDSTGSGGINKSDVPLLTPLFKPDTQHSYQANTSNDFGDSDSQSDIDADYKGVTIPSLGGTSNKTDLQISDPETEKRTKHRPPSIDAYPLKKDSSHHISPIKTPVTRPEQNIEESIIADLPLPDLPPILSTEFPDPFKELPPINSRQTNSSLGGMDDSNISATINSKKRSLEDNETEIEVSRDTWNTKNMRSLEPPRSKKRILLIAAVKTVKSIKPIRATLRYDEAITYNKNIIEKEKYIEAYQKEINQLLKMNTWDTDRYYDREDIDPKRVINSMFIFNKKRDGTHKARFVARGDVQHPDTYDSGMQSNTVHHYALMTSLSLALDNDYFITQLDISSAYLYADIKEELYIRPPPHLRMNNKLIRLRKSLYGLKQSGANWYETIKSYLIQQCDMKEVRGWSCVFKNSQLTICLFVDDMILFSKDLNANKKVIEKLKRQYDTKIINLGEDNDEIQYDILGLEIKYKRGKYMKLGMENSLTEKLPKINVPLNPKGKKLAAPGQPGLYIDQEELELEEDDYKMKVHEMQKLIGLASYVGYKFRFDLLYYINTLAQHILFPSKQVLDMTYELIQFIWDTRDRQLIWHKSKSTKPANNLVVISDASYGNQPYYKSQIGNVFLLNGKVIGGKSTKASLTCTSTTEAEIHAISESVPLLNNLSYLVQELNKKPITKGLLTDSKSTISIVMSKNEEKFRNRFFGTKAMRLRDEVSGNNLHVCYIETKKNIADVLTKPLPIKTFKLLTNKWIH